jgi:DNA mismatch repair protein MutL
MAIKKLPDELISQIAAGEVVERPSSVVKELIENALDAKATAISIRIIDAGKKLIEVSDDGKGIPQSELSLAVQRHATSKLEKAEDLFQISTLGFRGEALASVAAISRFTLTSKQTDAEMGGKITIDGGRVISVEETGVPGGTVVHVEDLFYNVPARYAFLKQPATEKNHINTLVFRYALAYPDVRWSLQQDHRPVLRSSGNGKRREILAVMYGISVSKDMIEVNLEESQYKVYGFISPSEVTRSNRREMTFFVNGRWVQDAGLSAALYKAYDTYIPPGRYPIAALFIELLPEEIDVNVHPAKAEVRFRNPQEIFSLVQRAVRRAFLAFTPVRQEAVDTWAGRTQSQRSSDTNQQWGYPRGIDPAWQMAADLRKSESSTEKFAYQTPIIPEGMDLLHLIGKMQQGYLLVEAPDGLYLIDERAAQERILYENLLRQVEEGGIKSVELENSLPLPFHGEGDSLIANLFQLGFDTELFGVDMVKVLAIPRILSEAHIETILDDLLKDFEESRFNTPEETTEFLMQKLVYHAGQLFSSGNDPCQQKNLISALQTCKSPRQTPDGRATMIHLSLEFMNRQFGRE